MKFNKAIIALISAFTMISACSCGGINNIAESPANEVKQETQQSVFPHILKLGLLPFFSTLNYVRVL